MAVAWWRRMSFFRWVEVEEPTAFDTPGIGDLVV
jgi:hypothetical protein